MNNKRGQSMMIGILMLIMAVIMFVAMIPAMATMFDSVRECDALNCAGFVDKDCTGTCRNSTDWSTGSCSSSDQSYYSTYEQNKLACTIVDIGLPYLILAVLIGLITKFLHGKLEDKPETYQSY